jgi:hypothetical protein
MNSIIYQYNIYTFGLWCLTSLPTIFQLDRGGQFYMWWKPEYTKPKMSQVTDKLYYIENLCSSWSFQNEIDFIDLN